jgi:uncharacterized Zn finger protein
MPRSKPRQSVSTASPEILPSQVAERQPTLAARLALLDRGQLQALVETLVARQPNLVELIEGHLNPGGLATAPTLSTKPSATRARRATAAAVTAIRRQMRSLLRACDYLGEATYGVHELAEQARPYLDAGDGNTWAEAILTADLTPAERQTWAEHLAGWHTEAAEYGIDTAFEVARVAAVQGWDDPELQRMLRGEFASFESDTAWAEPGLTLSTAQLNVLERQGRLEEALHLADATRQVDRYVSLLVRLDRLTEARRYGFEHLTQAHDALVLAHVLLEHGATQEALEIAEHGLSLAGELWTLATWLRDEAAAAGDADRATRAALVALRELRIPDDYQALESVAGDRWPTLRDAVLAELRQAAPHSPSGVGVIFVYEGLLDDAIAVADSAPYDYAMVEQVADAAIQTHPDWVISMGRRQAERIMDGGKARYYHHAVAWLRRSRAAALSAGRQDDWRQYVDGLLLQHARKYSLVPQLKQLRA